MFFGGGLLYFHLKPVGTKRGEGSQEEQPLKEKQSSTQEESSITI